MRRWLPDNVSGFADRHGRTRYRWRKAGFPTYYFKAEPGSDQFMVELAQARAADPLAKQAVGRAAAHGSLARLCQLFYQSPAYLKLDPATQSAYRRPLERFCEQHGGKPVARVTTQHIDAILGKMADRPAPANNLRKALGRVFTYAVKIGWRNDNPVRLTDTFPRGDGFHCWSEAEIAQFCTRWPLGTKPRLALELLLNTATRRCDVVKIGRRHMVDGRFEISHAKGGADTNPVILPECFAAIEAMPVVGMDALLITDFGKPFTANGFGNWFRKACREADLPHCSAHGVRKAISRRMAESGATTLQGRAITGQTRDETFAYYAKAASQRTMADAALANLQSLDLANRKKT